MRVLIFSNWFPPVISGSSYYASSLAQSLAARGHEITVVTLDWGPDDVPATNSPFPIYRLPAVRLPKLRLFYNLKLMGLAFTPRNYQRLRAIIKRHRTEILHHVNHIFDSTFLSTWAGYSAGIPVVGSITTPIQHQNPHRQWLMTAGDRLALGWFGVKKWDGVVSLDQTVHEYVGKVYGREAQQRSMIIPFGVRRESMALYDPPTAPRAGRPQILMVGHIHPFRNPAKLVRAMPLVLRSIPEARLIIAGRVDLKEPVEVAQSLGLSTDQVSFLGQTSHEETVRLMKTSHVFASWVTGPYHSLGTAPMEAMLCNMPVVNDIPENLFGERRLKNGENIVLVDSLDPRSIADALIRLLNDQALRERIGTAGRRFVLEHLSWDSIAVQMEGFYSRVLAKRRLPLHTKEPLRAKA